MVVLSLLAMCSGRPEDDHCHGSSCHIDDVTTTSTPSTSTTEEAKGLPRQLDGFPIFTPPPILGQVLDGFSIFTPPPILGPIGVPGLIPLR